MLERRIRRIDGGYVLYSEHDERIEAFLTAGSAERAAASSLRRLGGGVVVRTDGERVEVPAEGTPLAESVS